MLRTQVEEALAELVALGLASSDSFAGLRALLTPSEKRKPFGGRTRSPSQRLRHRGCRPLVAAAQAVAIRRVRDAVASEIDGQIVEGIVHALLRRYGVVFWKLLQREAAWLPPLARAAARAASSRSARRHSRRPVRRRRFGRAVRNARGGERIARHAAHAGASELVVVSGADPLNLVGVVLPGAKVPALTGNRVVYRDGAPIATLVGGEIAWIEPLDAAQRHAAEDLLIRGQGASPLLAYLR